MIRNTSYSLDEDRKFSDYFYSDYVYSEQTNTSDVDEKITVPTAEQGFVVGLYSTLLFIGGIGNVTALVSLLRSRRRKSRVALLMTHLAVADMIVTFVVIPLEIGWRTTNAWLAGNAACKVFLVLRAFGFYLSSNVLICISLDRFFAVLYPLRLPIARKRSKTMLGFAWLIAFMCSFPQSLVFRVLLHPKVPDFKQCVSFDAFPSQRYELAYNVFCLCAMYFLPLIVITICYTRIFYEISKNSKDVPVKSSSSDLDVGRVQLRRSDERALARARRRTLRMTLTIVTVFACCWLPYVTMTMWYMVDRQSAQLVSARIQDFFFVMAVSNSCVDPLVYGSYTIGLRAFIVRNMRKIFCIKKNNAENATESGQGTVKTKTATLNGAIRDKNVRLRRFRRPQVRFEETTLCPPSYVFSDPLPKCGDHELQNLCRIKPSRSCEVFTLEVADDVRRYN